MRMNKLKNISLESLTLNDSQSGYYGGHYDDSNEINQQLTISLGDLGETISLYDEYDIDDRLVDFEESDHMQTTKRLTWEEWYLKKRIQSLKNEKKMGENMQQKMNKKNGNRKMSVDEEAKKQALIDWIEKKRAQRFELEQKLAKISREKEINATKEKEKKEKAEQVYQSWLEKVKRDEHNQRVADEKKRKETAEKEKQKKLEQMKLVEEKRQQMLRDDKVRRIDQKKGCAMVNGKKKTFFDWSTSPDPGYVNPIEWKS